jgi:hypothetical protein
VKDKPISVSIRAPKSYTLGLKALAESKGTTVADLTRKAVDDCLGIELAPFLVFFAQNVYSDSHSKQSKDSSGPGAA